MWCNKSRAFILLALVAVNVIAPVRAEWIDISIQLRRSIGSAYAAIEYLGDGQLIEMLTAQEWKPTSPTGDLYRVSFIVEYTGGERQQCRADVRWIFRPTFIRQVEQYECNSMSQQGY